MYIARNPPRVPHFRFGSAAPVDGTHFTSRPWRRAPPWCHSRAWSGVRTVVRTLAAAGKEPQTPTLYRFVEGSRE
jgi:hypothetical protein